MSLLSRWLSKNRIFGRIRGRESVTCRAPLFFSFFLASLILFAACTSTRPILKIGLSAPFEGLYRRNGYEALAAMRSAIAETPVTDFAVMPLALDNSLDPARTIAKLLQDESLRAVIGPLTPQVALRSQTSINPTNLLWFTPFALNEQGMVAPHEAQWRLAWLRALVPALLAHNCQRLAVAGWQTDWSAFEPKDWSQQIGIEIVLIERLDELRSSDGLVWVGSAQAGGQFLGRLRELQSDLPFWTGLQGGDPVFAEQTALAGPTYWTAWLTDEYDLWATQHSPSSPLAYIVYYETRYAITTFSHELAGNESQEVSRKLSSHDWQLRFFPLPRKPKP